MSGMLAINDAAIDTDILSVLSYFSKNQNELIIKAQQTALGASGDLNAACILKFGLNEELFLARRIPKGLAIIYLANT